MTYNEIIKFFTGSKYYNFLDISLKHIIDKSSLIDFNSELFHLCLNFRNNEDIEFYIKLNDFFNNDPSIFEPLRALLLMSASNDILIKDYLSIENSFFVIHSVASYNVIYRKYPCEDNYDYHPSIGLLTMVVKSYLPEYISNIIFEHLTYSIAYARKYSTDYHFIKHILDNILVMPNLFENLKSYAYKNKYCIDFLIQLFEWCDDNNKENEHTDSFNKFFYLLKDVQEFTPSLDYDVQIELSLFRFRKRFNAEYDYNDLVDFYETNTGSIPILHELRILTALFLHFNKEKYISKFSEKIFRIETNDLRLLIENISPDVFSAYFMNLGYEYKNQFLDFLEQTYYCHRDILESTAFYFHANDYTYVFEKEQKKLDMNPELHSEIISYINEVNNLNITVKHEAKHQKVEHNIERENVPIDNVKNEKKYIDALKKYYHISDSALNEDIEYILLFQQMRVPLQQLLLQQYNKLFPYINIFNKELTPVKKVERILHVVLSESLTSEQERDVISYINGLSEDITFEYKNIDNFNDFMTILNSDEYSIISVTSHGNVNTRNPLDNQIKIGHEYIDMFKFQINYNNLNNKRLLYLNICDSGHYSLKNGFMVESLSAQLVDNTQALISNMWPIDQIYSSTFLMIFFHHIIKIKDYKEAYKITLLLAINNELDNYICDNNLDLDELELFRVFHNRSLNKESITHWGAMMYQE